MNTHNSTHDNQNGNRTDMNSRNFQNKNENPNREENELDRDDEDMEEGRESEGINEK